MKTLIVFVLGVLVGVGAVFAPVLTENVCNWYNGPPSNSSELAVAIYDRLENRQWKLVGNREGAIVCDSVVMTGLNTRYSRQIQIAEDDIGGCLTKQELAYIFKKAVLIHNALKDVQGRALTEDKLKYLKEKS